MVNRKLLGAAIALAWLATMALLIHRDVLGGDLRGSVVLDREHWIEEPSESWIALYGGVTPDSEGDPASIGDRIGHAWIRQRPDARDGLAGVEMDVRVQLSLELLGRRTGLELSGNVWRARDERRAELDFSVRSGQADFRLEGVIVDDTLRATVDTGGETTDLEARVPDNALFTTGFGTSLNFPVLEPGERAVVQSFDPMTLEPTRSTIRALSRDTREVEGATVPVTRLRVESGGLETVAWVDDAGQVVEARTPLGLALVRTSREEALRPITGGDAARDLLAITAVRPIGPTPRRGARALTVRIPGVEGFTGLRPEPGPARRADEREENAGLAIPLDWRQRQVESGTGGPVFRIGAQPPPHETPSPEQLDSYLGSDAFIQSGHPRIRSEALSVVGASVVVEQGRFSPEAERAAVALHEHVYESLTKVPVLSLPSALEVLDSGRGDCNEHAILYTALARSAGIPTRVAIGLVWSDLLDAFYYHAWPEVWLGDRWRALDPTLGQERADATHIKLLEGGIERWTRLLPFLGRLEIEVLDQTLGEAPDAAPAAPSP